MATNLCAQLPVDLLHEIFLRLPAKPLCRLRAVCRSWRSLLSDPLFVGAHAARHPHLVAAVCGNQSLDLSTPVAVHILDTVGQVVRRVSAGKCWPQTRTHDSLFLLAGVKPTRRLLLLDLLTTRLFSLPHDCSAATTSTWQWHTLGRAASTGEPKVLRIRTATEHGLPQVLKIFAASGGSGWRDAQSPPAPINVAGRRREAVVKGVIYFSAPDNRIAAFDIQSERWQPDPFRGPPLPESDNGQVMILTELSGSLVVAAFDGDQGATDLWFLVDRDKAVWCKRYAIAMSPHAYPEACNPGKKNLLQPLRVLDDGRILFCLWYKCYKRYSIVGLLGMYDPANNTYTNVGEVENCINAVLGVYNGNLLTNTGCIF